MYGHDAWWVGQLMTPKIVKVTSRSSEVILGQIGYTLVYGHETWWMGSIVNDLVSFVTILDMLIFTTYAKNTGS